MVEMTKAGSRADHAAEKTVSMKADLKARASGATWAVVMVTVRASRMADQTVPMTAVRSVAR
jgi:hypothetical protein